MAGPVTSPLKMKVAIPVVIYHRKANNPYLSLYGDDWESVMKQKMCTLGFVSVTDVVNHIVEASAAVMKGTQHEDDWVFYHDALTIMSNNPLRNYMRDKGILHRWILPQQKLHDDDDTLSRYKDRPPGDSPELMPWDNNLNQDVHAAVKLHINATDVLDKTDPNKFSLPTPIAGSSAYRRVLDPETGGSPSSGRIVQDCSLWVHALRAIIKSGGALNDFAKRRGRRGEFTESERESMPTQRGGSRTKGSGNKKERWLHVDAISAIDIKLEETRKTREQEDPDSQAPMEIEESSVALLPV